MNYNKVGVKKHTLNSEGVIYFSADIMDISIWAIMLIFYLYSKNMEVDIEATNRVNSVRLREACP